MDEIAQRLMQARIAAGFKTAKDFAVAHGIPQATYALHEGGKRGLSRKFSDSDPRETLEVYAEKLGVRAAWLKFGEQPVSQLENDNHRLGSVASSREKVMVAPPNNAALTFDYRERAAQIRDLPIRGHTKAGKEGLFLDQGEHWGFAMRPESLRGVKDAYAVRVHDESMEPRYKAGYVLQVDPYRTPVPGDNIVVQLLDGQAFVKELVRRTEKVVVCRQFNPLMNVEYKRSQVRSMHMIVGVDYLER